MTMVSISKKQVAFQQGFSQKSAGRRDTVFTLTNDSLQLGMKIGKGAFGHITCASSLDNPQVAGVVKVNYRDAGTNEDYLHGQIAHLERQYATDGLPSPNLVAGGINPQGMLVMRRYDGTLKELMSAVLEVSFGDRSSSEKFKECKDYLDVKLLSDLVYASYSLTAVLEATHNDIHELNVFIKWSQNELQFLLGDYGKATLTSSEGTVSDDKMISGNHQKDLLKIIGLLIEFRYPFSTLTSWYHFVSNLERDLRNERPSPLQPGMLRAAIEKCIGNSLEESDPILGVLPFIESPKPQDDLLKLSFHLHEVCEQKRVPLNKELEVAFRETVQMRQSMLMSLAEEGESGSSPWS